MSPSSASHDGGRADPPILVLVNPQDIVNIASAVRIAKNFGIERMRLVDPEVFDPYRIEGIAHNTAEFVARIDLVPTLAEAVADCVFTAVLTGRERAAKRHTLRPREAAAELVSRAVAGPVALQPGLLGKSEVSHIQVAPNRQLPLLCESALLIGQLGLLVFANGVMNVIAAVLLALSLMLLATMVAALAAATRPRLRQDPPARFLLPRVRGFDPTRRAPPRA